MVHYSLNTIRLAVDAQYRNVVLILLTYLVALASKTTSLGLDLKMLASKPSLQIASMCTSSTISGWSFKTTSVSQFTR